MLTEQYWLGGEITYSNKVESSHGELGFPIEPVLVGNLNGEVLIRVPWYLMQLGIIGACIEN
jgi:hypothetical protein